MKYLDYKVRKMRIVNGREQMAGVPKLVKARDEHEAYREGGLRPIGQEFIQVLLDGIVVKEVGRH